MKNLNKIYEVLLKRYGSQNWWPLTQRYKFLPEYRGKKPETNDRRFEIIAGAILTQYYCFN